MTMVDRVDNEVEAIRLRVGATREEFERMTALEVARRLADLPEQESVDQLLAEVVEDSDVCPGCNHLYRVPGRRDPVTDRWAWRHCPTSTCVHYGRRVAYSLDWTARARRRLVDMAAALDQSRRQLTELADAAEEYASSEPYMPSHADTEARFEAALVLSREVATGRKAVETVR